MKISIISYLFVLQLIIINVAIAQSLTHDTFKCTGGSYPPNSVWEKNSKIAFDRVLKDIVDFAGFSYTSEGVNAEEFWTAGFCPSYVKPDACKDCVKKLIPVFGIQCRNKKAIAWSLKCMILKTDDARTYRQLDDWSYLRISLDAKVAKVDEFDSTWKKLADKLTSKVVFISNNTNNKPFLSGNEKYGSQTLYMAVECVGKFNVSICQGCLNNQLKEMKSCCSGKTTASLMSANCYIKHALENFLN